MNKDGRGDSRFVILVVNRKKDTVVVILKP